MRKVLIERSTRYCNSGNCDFQYPVPKIRQLGQFPNFFDTIYFVRFCQIIQYYFL